VTWEHGSHVPLFVVVFLVLIYLVIPPLIFTVETSLREETGFEVGGLTLKNYGSILSTPNTIDLIFNSVRFALGSAAVALFLGTLLAWIVERTNTPLRGIVYITAFISFAVPGIIKVVGWILLLGPRAGLINVWLMDLFHLEAAPFNIFSMSGMILIESVLWAPTVFLLMAVPFRSMDPSLEEASSISGASRWKTFFNITFKLAIPSILSVLLITFVRAIESFEIPALIGIPGGITVLTTEIYLKIRGGGLLPSYGDASAYAVLLIAVVSILLYFYSRATGESYKFQTITGKGFRPRIIDLGPWRCLTGALILLLPALLVLPLGALLWASLLPYYEAPSVKLLSSLSLANYVAAFNNTNVQHSFRNSLFIALISASASVFLTAVTAWLVVRTKIRGRWILDNLATLPLALPGIVMGLAVLRTYLTIPIPVYGTVWILILAFVARYLPYGMRYCYSGLLQIHQDLEEVSQVSGASWWATFRKVVLPLLAPALFGGWVFIFLICIRELSMAIILYGPRSQVIATTIWELYENGQITELSAFSIVIVFIVVVIAVGFHRFSQRYGIHV
jgi:iron(III) transport system permease protein